VVTAAVARLLTATDSSRRVREVIGDLDALEEAVKQVRPWMSFAPDRFERRTVNERLRELGEGKEVGVSDEIQGAGGGGLGRR
jgi:hypothetical protein